MHVFEYILIMLGAVLVSNLISRQFPRISTPLVQIAIGFALTILPISFEVSLDPELFMVLFIAPLLFEDAKKADKVALWKLKRPILMLALALVFLTTLTVGFAINLFTPSIPLAAAFALAAALAPTDAVAVASLKSSATIKQDQEHLLQGEALLNDASGIVSFQFAIAAVLTGSFSVLDASTSFLRVFFGGLIVGIVLMLARQALVNFLKRSRVDNTTFDVLFELITPFLVFIVAEGFEVSGIIAVVAAGIAYSFSPQRTTPSTARHNLVSASTWSVLSFSLNGLIFLMLGTQLPYVIQRVWSSSPSADYLLIGLIVLILAAILLIRFLWILIIHRDVDLAKAGVEQEADGMNGAGLAEVIAVQNSPIAPEQQWDLDANPTSTFAEDIDELQDEDSEFQIKINAAKAEGDALRKQRRKNKRESRIKEKRSAHASPDYWKLHLHDALLLSLTGVKGAITLAVVLTIPLTLNDSSPFPERDLIIFLASGVIVLSLLTANFLVPLVAPKKADPIQPQAEVSAILDIYRQVIATLLAKVTPQNKAATDEIIQHYYSRLENSKLDNQKISEADTKIRMMIVGWEQENTLKLIDEGKVSAITGLIYMNQLSRVLARLQHHSAIGWELQALGKQLTYHFKQFRRRFRQARQLRKVNRKKTILETRSLSIVNYQYAIEKLEAHLDDTEAPRSLVKLIIIELERRVARLQNPRDLLRSNNANREDILLEVETQAMEYERESIKIAAECHRISSETAKELLDNVAIMELDIEEQLN